MCSGILVGLVASDAPIDRIEPWAAVCIGAIASLFYILGCKLLEVLKIDDPIESTCIHGFGGFWGVLSTGFFDNQNGLFYRAPHSGVFFGY